ncbi:Aminoacyl-tRNA synthetase, class I, conserved site [Ceraceosorus bombacis]|uniref:Aminoacyl-tRNA synthetase, class I, conserved site n=1 Tax=Ceraceosorus bombacis TaxID=401625 RepID=A0A0P1BCX8_9BASI|nr:Aminoacyl-tRNA synthetase, class I, conserved site [Ceraceosorus bombacis]
MEKGRSVAPKDARRKVPRGKRLQIDKLERACKVGNDQVSGGAQRLQDGQVMILSTLEDVSNLDGIFDQALRRGTARAAGAAGAAAIADESESRRVGEAASGSHVQDVREEALSSSLPDMVFPTKAPRCDRRRDEPMDTSVEFVSQSRMGTKNCIDGAVKECEGVGTLKTKEASSERLEEGGRGKLDDDDQIDTSIASGAGATGRGQRNIRGKVRQENVLKEAATDDARDALSSDSSTTLETRITALSTEPELDLSSISTARFRVLSHCIICGYCFPKSHSGPAKQKHVQQCSLRMGTSGYEVLGVLQVEERRRKEVWRRESRRMEQERGVLSCMIGQALREGLMLSEKIDRAKSRQRRTKWQGGRSKSVRGQSKAKAKSKAESKSKTIALDKESPVDPSIEELVAALKSKKNPVGKGGIWFEYLRTASEISEEVFHRADELLSLAHIEPAKLSALDEDGTSMVETRVLVPRQPAGAPFHMGGALSVEGRGAGFVRRSRLEKDARSKSNHSRGLQARFCVPLLRQGEAHQLDNSTDEVDGALASAEAAGQRARMKQERGYRSLLHGGEELARALAEPLWRAEGRGSVLEKRKSEMMDLA